MSAQPIRPHNITPAAIWNSGGQAYDRISETVADSIEHCVLRLDPQPGERVLDVATGTGWAARQVAARGAHVIGIDFGADLIEAAKAAPTAPRLEIDFRVGDAEMLSFEDQTFDLRFETGPPYCARPAAKRSGICS